MGGEFDVFKWSLVSVLLIPHSSKVGLHVQLRAVLGNFFLCSKSHYL